MSSILARSLLREAMPANGHIVKVSGKHIKIRRFHMKKSFALLVVCMLVIGLLAGCGGGDKKPAAPAAAPASAPAAKPAASAEETLAAIMMKSKQVPGFSCDVNVTGPGFSSTSKMWVGKEKMRMENTFEGKKMITLVDGDTTYMYDPATQTAMKFSGKDLPAGA